MKSTDILRVENMRHDPDTFIIRWQMTRACNYVCAFCVQAGNKPLVKNESAVIRESICRNLVSFMEDRLDGRAKVIQLYLIGGEVTILKDFIPLLERLVGAAFHGIINVCITTNMSMDEELCRRLRAVFEGRKRRTLNLSCSYYEAYADEDAFFRNIGILDQYPFHMKIFDRWGIRRLLGWRLNIHCSVGYPLACDDDYSKYKLFISRHPEYAKRINPIIIRDYKTSVSWDVKRRLNGEKRLRGPIKVTLKDGRVEYFMTSNDISMILDEEPYFMPRGFLCDIGISNMTIDPEGNISRCVSAPENTAVGNISEAPPAFLTERIRCPAKRCACSYYSRIENDLD